MISTLDKKLLRGMRDMKAQIVAIALVMATGIATFVMSVGIIDSLELSLKSYYDEYRFGDVFVGVKRAPQSLVGRLESIPGVTRVMTRVILGATLDIEGMIEPATAMLVSLPEGGQPPLNGLHLRSGRLVEPYRDNEGVVADTFAEEHDLKSGDEITATISGHQRTLKVVGVALLNFSI